MTSRYDLRRRYRLVAQHVEGEWVAVNVVGATDLGIPTQPEDEVIVLYPPDTNADVLKRFIAGLRRAGHEVVEDVSP